MRSFYLVIIGVVVVIVVIYMFPTVRTMLGLIDTSDWVPLMRAWLAFIPWFLLIVAAWYLFNKVTGRQ